MTFKRDCNSKSLRYKFPIIKWMPGFIGKSITDRGIARIRTCMAIFIREVRSLSLSVSALLNIAKSPQGRIGAERMPSIRVFIRLSVMTVTPDCRPAALFA